MSLPPNILHVVSIIADGSMSAGVTDEQRLDNRRSFLEGLDIAAEKSLLVHLKYEGDDYCRYSTVGSDHVGDGVVRPSTMTADALFTTSENVALLLPVADCIGVVLYDPVQQVLGLSHLGRHNLIQDGGTKAIEYMVDNFGSAPSDVQIWLSPAAGGEMYPLFDFDNRSLLNVAREQLQAAGVPSDNIEADGRDTTTDASLFSHSEFLKDKRDTDGRQMVVAMMRV